MAATTLSPTDSAPAAADVPFTVQDRRRKGFFTIDNEFIDRFGPLLGPGGIAVFNVLARFANQESECFPSQAKIAHLAGMSRMQVSRELTKLKGLKLIAVEHRFAPSGSQRSNLYILLDLPPVTECDTPCNTPLHPPVTDSYTPHNGQLHLKNNTKEMNNTQKEQDLRQQHRRRQPNRAPNPVPADKQDVVVALTDLGISAGVASRLAGHYSRERVLEKIAYLEFLQAERPESAQNPCGWLRRAIEQDYVPPDGFRTPEDRERQIAEAARQAQEEAEQQRISAQARQSWAQALEAKRKAEEEARRQALAARYGTTQREEDLWNAVLATLKLQMPATTFEWFIADAKLVKLADGKATLALANPATRDWVENRLAHQIKRVLNVEARIQNPHMQVVEEVAVVAAEKPALADALEAAAGGGSAAAN